MNSKLEHRAARCWRTTAPRGLWGCALLLSLAVLVAQTQPPSSASREHAGYITPEGSIQVVTCSCVAGIVRALNTVFVSTHPGVKFSVLEGDNYSAMAALTFDRTAFAPLGAAYTRIGLGDNLKIASEPLAFRIAHASLASGGRVPALGIIVNPANAITSLSLGQLTRIFAVGAPLGDIATWGQAGVIGSLANRAIHPVGPPPSDERNSEDPQAGEFLSTDKMAGLRMNHNYTVQGHYADAVQFVAQDPAAIGITALNQPLANVKVLALKTTDTGKPIPPSSANIAAGIYPLDRFVYIYLRVGKGMPPDEFGMEYMRTALSDAGQRAIASEAAGYIPLNAGELAEERAKLDR
jgi:phosphate transport system substrate-binding protein